MKRILLIIALLSFQGCAMLDWDAWKHSPDSEKVFTCAFKYKVKIEIKNTKEDVLGKWGKPHDIWASGLDQATGSENWEYYEIMTPKDVLFNGTYYHWTLKFKNKELVNIHQEYITQDAKNVWSFDEIEESTTNVETQLKAEGLL